MANEIKTTFTGDDSDLQKTFDKVGAGAKDMASDVGSASKKMANSTDLASTEIAGRVDNSEKRFRGMGDTINGTGDIMEGFRTGNVALLAMGMADMAGAMTDFMIPALNAAKNAIVTGLTPALTMISAHPLIAGLLIGGAIIAGLILLEKKFGVVSTAVGWVRDRLNDLWDRFSGLVGQISGLGGKLVEVITWPYKTAFNLIAKVWNNTVGRLKFEIPSWVPGLGGKGFSMPNLPTFHTGGVFPGNAGMPGLAILQAGETVTPRGQNGGGAQIVINVSGVGMGRDFGNAVARALRENGLIGVTI